MTSLGTFPRRMRGEAQRLGRQLNSDTKDANVRESIGFWLFPSWAGWEGYPTLGCAPAAVELWRRLFHELLHTPIELSEVNVTRIVGGNGVPSSSASFGQFSYDLSLQIQ